MVSRRFDELNDRMLLRLFEINPEVATRFGVHGEHDHHLSNGGSERIKDTMDLLDEWHGLALEVSRSDQLSPDQLISLEILKMAVETQRFAIDDYPLWRMYPDGLEAPGVTMLLMIVRNYAPFEERMAALSSRLSELPRYLAQFRERFEGQRPVRLWTQMAIESCRSFPSFLTYVEEHAKGQVSDGLMAGLMVNTALAAKEAQRHLEWLKGLLDRSTDDFHMGRQRFEKLMRIRGMEHTPDQMLALAQKYLAELKAERDSIARRIAPSGSIGDAYEMIKTDCPETFEDVLDETERQMESAKRYIVEHGLATVEEGLVLEVIETPQFMTTFTPSAALEMPAQFEKVQEGLYLVTRPSDPKDLRSLWNRAMIINTAVHEAYPGHFHQGVASNASPWMHQLLHMLMSPDTMITAYETQEGWAHYCEKMMYDHGFEKTDMAAVVMLDAAIWRAVRVVYDVKLAYDEATVAEMSELLAHESNTPIAAASADVRSFTRTPGYPICYLIGRHMVFQLRAELEAKLGKDFDIKRFHDIFARNGNLPFYLARRAVRDGMAERAR